MTATEAPVGESGNRREGETADQHRKGDTAQHIGGNA
jgi:hypothetical protein